MTNRANFGAKAVSNDQLQSLKDTLARDKHCLAAAQLELDELTADRTKIEERICEVERRVKAEIARVQASWNAVRHRIDAETDSPLEGELIERRCLKSLPGK